MNLRHVSTALSNALVLSMGGLVVGAGTAGAAQQDLNVTTEVQGQCLFGVATDGLLDFGTIDSTVIEPVQQTFNVEIVCSEDGVARIDFGDGQNHRTVTDIDAVLGGARHMQNVDANAFVSYLFRYDGDSDATLRGDVALAAYPDDIVSLDVTVEAFEPHLETIIGEIPAAQGTINSDLPFGTYSDVVEIAITLQ